QFRAGRCSPTASTSGPRRANRFDSAPDPCGRSHSRVAMKQFVKNVLERWFGLVTRGKYQHLLGRAPEEIREFEGRLPPEAAGRFAAQMRQLCGLSLDLVPGLSAPEWERLRRCFGVMTDDAARALLLAVGDWMAGAAGRKQAERLRQLETAGELAPALWDDLRLFCEAAAFRRAQEHSRLRELYLAEIFDGIERVSLPVGAIHQS